MTEPQDSQDAANQPKPFSLRDTITSGRLLLTNSIATARTHSPFADEKLEAADDAVAGVIHTGYQAVKRIIVDGHPAVILTCASIAASVPSIPFGVRAVVRNTGLAFGLAAVMIYPDHLKAHLSTSARSEQSKE